MNNGCVFHAVSYLKTTAIESQASEFQSCVSGCSAQSLPSVCFTCMLSSSIHLQLVDVQTVVLGTILIIFLVAFTFWKHMVQPKHRPPGAASEGQKQQPASPQHPASSQVPGAEAGTPVQTGELFRIRSQHCETLSHWGPFSLTPDSGWASTCLHRRLCDTTLPLYRSSPGCWSQLSGEELDFTITELFPTL